MNVPNFTFTADIGVGTGSDQGLVKPTIPAPDMPTLIEARIKKWDACKKALSSAGCRSDRNADKAALALSLQVSSPNELLFPGPFQILNESLLQLGCQDSIRLEFVCDLLTKEVEPIAIASAARVAYGMFANGGFGNSFTSLRLGCRAVNATYEVPQAMLDRYNDLQLAAKKHGWVGTGFSSVYFISSLLNFPQSNIIDIWHDTETLLLKQGVEESIESAFASLYLLGENPAENAPYNATRFLELYHRQKDHWGAGRGNYILISALARSEVPLDVCVRELPVLTFNLERSRGGDRVMDAVALITGDPRDVFLAYPYKENNRGIHRHVTPEKGKILNTIESPGYVSAQKEITLKKQESGYTCGPASARMAIHAVTGHMYAESDVAFWLGTTAETGTHISYFENLSACLPGLEVVVETESSFNRVRDLISQGFTVILNFRPGKEPHYAVVKGISEKSIIFVDPASNVPERIVDIADINWSGGYDDMQTERGLVALR